MKENHRILPYSAIKMRANFNPPYSTLNPDTSSDSPSAKSKGARLVSATQQTKHKKKKHTQIKKLTNRVFKYQKFPKLNLNKRKEKEKIKKTRGSS